MHINSYGALKFSGLEAEKFLQSQLSCDVSDVRVSEGMLAAYCDRQGYVQVLFYLLKVADDFYAIMPSNILISSAALFKKYAVFSKITIDIFPQISIELLVKTLPEGQLFGWRYIADTQFKLFYSGLTAEQKFLLPEENNIETLWRAYQIFCGLPFLQKDTIGKFRPHDLNLPELAAVSFTKGCYPGQEIVARMQYRGKPKQHLYRLQIKMPGPFLAGEIYSFDNENKNFTVVDVLFVEGKNYWLMTVVMKDDFFAEIASADVVPLL